MNSIRAGLDLGTPGEVRFGATVTGAPHFFFGRKSHAVHESFGVRSDDGVALKVVDNVSLAPPVAVTPGDRVVVQGVLIPSSARGPLVHWTHHDPHGHHVGGFIEWNGRVYA
jgi:hypothetical protein